MEALDVNLKAFWVSNLHEGQGTGSLSAFLTSEK
jgi:hypothetical protein